MRENQYLHYTVCYAKLLKKFRKEVSKGGSLYYDFFALSVGLNLTVTVKSEFNQEFTFMHLSQEFIQHHPTAVTCLPIAAVLSLK